MTKEDHTPEETDFIKWGLLYKRRNGMGKWTREPWQYRFFTLTVDGVLNYYDMGKIWSPKFINKFRFGSNIGKKSPTDFVTVTSKVFT